MLANVPVNVNENENGNDNENEKRAHSGRGAADGFDRFLGFLSPTRREEGRRGRLEEDQP